MHSKLGNLALLSGAQLPRAQIALNYHRYHYFRTNSPGPHYSGPDWPGSNFPRTDCNDVNIGFSDVIMVRDELAGLNASKVEKFE